jgi:hypothetical protein
VRGALAPSRLLCQDPPAANELTISLLKMQIAERSGVMARPLCKNRLLVVLGRAFVEPYPVASAAYRKGLAAYFPLTFILVFR